MRFYYWAAALTASTLVATSAPATSRYVNPTDADEVVFHASDIRMPLVRESKLRNSDEATSKRTETIKYNSWVLVCRFVAGNTTKKTCSASLRVIAKGRQQPLLLWQIHENKDGQFVSTFHVPPLIVIRQAGKAKGGPLLVQSGMDLKFGNESPIHINYVWCGPKQCIAEALIDDAFEKEAAANTNATITLRTGIGAVVPIDVSIKGIEKAISATRQ